MYDLSSRRLKTAASGRLSQAAYHPGKLALLHSLALGGMLVLDLVFYLLDLQIAKTGGLAGMGTRAALESIQTVLNLAYSLALPFWQVSFALCGLKLARGEEATPNDYPEGFRRFGPVLRLFLTQTIIYFFVIMVAANIASVIFVMTPYANRMIAAMEPMLETGVMDEAVVEAMLPYMTPLYVIMVPVLLGLCVPVFYRLRFARFAIMDTHRMGALAAVRLSWGMSRGNRWKLFRIDLSFWWYYLLQGIALALTDGGYYLQLLGINLPLPQIVTTLLLRAVGIGVSLLVAWRYQSYVEATFATAYDTILTPPAEP